jgi:hypothetical protein
MATPFQAAGSAERINRAPAFHRSCPNVAAAIPSGGRQLAGRQRNRHRLMREFRLRSTLALLS